MSLGSQRGWISYIAAFQVQTVGIRLLKGLKQGCVEVTLFTQPAKGCTAGAMLASHDRAHKAALQLWTQPQWPVCYIFSDILMCHVNPAAKPGNKLKPHILFFFLLIPAFPDKWHFPQITWQTSKKCIPPPRSFLPPHIISIANWQRTEWLTYCTSI